MDLEKILPQLMPLACQWAEEQSQYTLRNGTPLTGRDLDIARNVGVSRPDLIRVLVVTAMPRPQHPLLAEAAEQLRFLRPDTQGLTLGYGIFVRIDCQRDRTLIAHECRHVYQYEQSGSIKSFLEVYVPDLLKFGYERCPLEVDACDAAGRCTFSWTSSL
ncbi:MAG TPA: hypothetical protein VFC63_09775 [Blastocatellia bacterium]|nr:hypothetical protein [Blastocatellia bacterium]